MATPFRIRVSTYTLPDGSHRTPDGKRVTKDTPGAVKQVGEKSEMWYGNYRDAAGILHRRVPLCPNHAAAKQMLAKLVTDAKLGTVNLTGIFEKHHKRPLTEHLEDYRRNLEADGNCADYVSSTHSRIQAIITGCEFTFITTCGPRRSPTSCTICAGTRRARCCPSVRRSLPRGSWSRLLAESDRHGSPAYCVGKGWPSRARDGSESIPAPPLSASRSLFSAASARPRATAT